MKSDHQVFIGETEFTIPEKETEVIRLYIYLAAPKFNEDALQADFGQLSTDKVNFIRDLKSYLLSFDRAVLRQMVEGNKGELAVNLNGHKVSLKHRHHFFFGLRDMHSL